MENLTMPEELLRWIKEDGLPLPPLPLDLAGELEEAGDYLYAARTPKKSLLLGFTGHGLQSWRFLYQLRAPGLAFDLSLPYARAFGDPEAEKEDLQGGFILVRLCLATAEKGQANTLEVGYDEIFCVFRCLSPEGEIIHEDEGLGELLSFLETSGVQGMPTDWMPV